MFLPDPVYVTGGNNVTNVIFLSRIFSKPSSNVSGSDMSKDMQKGLDHVPASQGSSKKTENRKTYHYAQLKEALIETALRLTSERDGPVFSLRELATALGVSHTAVYRHFADKDALLEEMTQMGFAEMAAAQVTAQSKAGPAPLMQLRALCAAYIRFAVDYPGYFTLMFNSRLGSPVASSARDSHNSGALKVLIDAIRACQVSKDIVDGDPERLAAYLVLAPHGMCSYIASGHIPGFIARQQEGLNDAADWMAQVGIEPFLIQRRSPDAFARLFFSKD